MSGPRLLQRRRPTSNIMTSYLPAVIPQHRPDPRRSYRQTLAGASPSVLVAATGVTNPLPAYAIMQRAAPSPLDHLDVAKDVAKLAALDSRAPKSTDQLVKD